MVEVNQGKNIKDKKDRFKIETKYVKYVTKMCKKAFSLLLFSLSKMLPGIHMQERKPST